MLSEEETEKIKKDIISQIESSFPADKIEMARNQVEEMNSEQLEAFLEKNRLAKAEGENKCVFCSIVSGDIKSCKIDEDEKNIVVFEINPVSRGHTLVISKEHLEKPQKGAMSFAKKIAKKLKTKLKSKDIQIAHSSLFGHSVINIIPVYKDETIDSKRNPTTMEELEKLNMELEAKTTKTVKKSKIEKIKERLWLPKRIP